MKNKNAKATKPAQSRPTDCIVLDSSLIRHLTISLARLIDMNDMLKTPPKGVNPELVGRLKEKVKVAQNAIMTAVFMFRHWRLGDARRLCIEGKGMAVRALGISPTVDWWMTLYARALDAAAVLEGKIHLHDVAYLGYEVKNLLDCKDTEQDIRRRLGRENAKAA